MRLALAALAVALSGPAIAADVISARYEEPTERYAHGVLGDAIEHGALVMVVAGGKQIRVRLPEHRVFEDTEPRLFDVDGDGEREVIVVESDRWMGARLSIYDSDGLVASNEFIGRPFRWLAPAGIGAVDLDSDGRVELIFVDRPHLAKELVIMRFSPGSLEPVARFQAVTNHRIGERDIAGGIRTCAGTPEVVVADASWREVLAIRFDGKAFDVSRLGPHRGRESFAKAMACK